MQQAQGEMFSKGFIDVANLSLAALVFGQLTAGKVVDIGLMALGVVFWIIIYHRCPLKRKAAVMGILRPLTPGLSHALLPLPGEDGRNGWKVVERRARS